MSTAIDSGGRHSEAVQSHGLLRPGEHGLSDHRTNQYNETAALERGSRLINNHEQELKIVELEARHVANKEKVRAMKKSLGLM